MPFYGVVASKAARNCIERGNRRIHNAKPLEGHGGGGGIAEKAAKKHQPERALNIVNHTILFVLASKETGQKDLFMHPVRSSPRINPGFDNPHGLVLPERTPGGGHGKRDINPCITQRVVWEKVAKTLVHS